MHVLFDEPLLRASPPQVGREHNVLVAHPANTQFTELILE